MCQTNVYFVPRLLHTELIYFFFKRPEFAKFCSATYALLSRSNNVAGFNSMQKMKACNLLSSAAGNFFFLL